MNSLGANQTSSTVNSAVAGLVSSIEEPDEPVSYTVEGKDFSYLKTIAAKRSKASKAGRNLGRELWTEAEITSQMLSPSKSTHARVAVTPRRKAIFRGH